MKSRMVSVGKSFGSYFMLASKTSRTVVIPSSVLMLGYMTAVSEVKISVPGGKGARLFILFKIWLES